MSVRPSEERNDEGATLVFVVITLFAILAFVALAVDGGSAFLDIRKSQNAADNAATAAALEQCSPSDSAYTDPEEAAESVAATNQYGDIDYALQGGGRHRVDISTETGLYLMRAVPFLPDSFTVDVSATAACLTTPSAADFALFGKGQCGNSTVQISASDIQVGDGSDADFNGAVYSGAVARFTGSDPYVEGPILTVGSSGNNIPDTPRDDLTENGDEQEYPLPLSDLTWSDFANEGIGGTTTWPLTGSSGNGGANGYNYINYGNSEVTFDDLVDDGWVVDNADGTYGFRVTAVFVARQFDLKQTGTGNAPLIMNGSNRVTFVSRGDIRLPDTTNLAAYYKPDPSWGPGLLAFAWGNAGATQTTGSCDDAYNQQLNRGKGILGGGTGGGSGNPGVAWEGIMFAPHGEVNIAGQSGSTNDGPLIGWNIKISGSGYTLGAANDSGFDPTRRVVLVDPTS